MVMKMIALIFSTLLCGCATSVKVPVISDFNATHYLGRWHEIARLDHIFERGLEQVTAEYTLREDGKIGVINRGFDTKKGEWKEAHAYAVQTRTPNYLKVYFIPLIAGKYRIAYINPTYTLSLVSGGNLSYLWILARTPQITPQELEQMLRLAQKMGYDTSKLIYPKP